MDTRRLAVLSIALLLLAGCEGNAARRPYSGELQAQADAIERQAQAVAMQETAEAQATRQSQDVIARATTDALNAQAQATRQVMDAQATAQALSVQATAQAMNLEATRTTETRSIQATATAEARNAQATATAGAATATMQSAQAAVEGTAQAAVAISAEATAQAVQRETEREQITQPLRTFGPWALLLAGLVAVVYIGLKAWTLFEDRSRLVRRGPDEGEPLMLITRERLALPLRQFGPYVDMTHQQERAPLLAPTVEAQAETTMRQQASNAILAQQAGQIAEAKSTREPEKHITVIKGGASRRQVSRGRRKTEAGLIGPLTEESIPPKLLEAITAEWEVVEDD